MSDLQKLTDLLYELEIRFEVKSNLIKTYKVVVIQDRWYNTVEFYFDYETEKNRKDIENIPNFFRNNEFIDIENFKGDPHEGDYDNQRYKEDGDWLTYLKEE
jgi:hypothetical protein